MAADAGALTFAPMTEADLDSVLRNETRAYAYPWTHGIFLDCLNGGVHECWLARHEERVVGHTVFTLAADEAHLLNLCIGRDWQGGGCGRAFLSFVLEQVDGRARAMFLEVRASNRVAVALYESFGFLEVGIRKDYYPAPLGREDARVMALAMSAVPS